MEHTSAAVAATRNAIAVYVHRWTHRRGLDLAPTCEPGTAVPRWVAYRWALMCLLRRPTALTDGVVLTGAVVFLAVCTLLLGGMSWWSVGLFASAVLLAGVGLAVGKAEGFRRSFAGLGLFPVSLAYAQRLITACPAVWRHRQPRGAIAASLRIAALRMGKDDTETLVERWWADGSLLDPRSLARAADALDTVDIMFGQHSRDEFFVALLHNPTLRHDPGAVAWMLAASGDDAAWDVAALGHWGSCGDERD